MMMNDCAMIYVHIPFCIRKCAYCDFLSFSAPHSVKEAYRKALLAEISARKEEAGGKYISSVFFGGGTPTALPPAWLAEFLDALRKNYIFADDAEITTEANPGTLCAEGLRLLKNAGFNRISIGVQSLNDRELKDLGRIHTAEEAETAYHLAREAGFTNINLDLMSGIPGQTKTSWEDTLHRVCRMGPEHISAYSLIIEEGTLFFENQESLELPDEDTEREMYESTRKILAEYGFTQYEISNYAKAGFACRHNIGYWTGVPYIGMGLHASSYDGRARWTNAGEMRVYLDHYAGGQFEASEGTDFNRPAPGSALRCEEEILTEEDLMAEFMILGLRMNRGISEAEFAARFGCSICSQYGDRIRKYTGLGLLTEMAGRLFLTEKGRSLSNIVMADFLP